MDQGALLKYNEDTKEIVSAEDDADIYNDCNENFKEVLFLA